MPTCLNDLVSIDRPKTNSRIFAHTRWDTIPVAAGILHCAYFFGMFYLFPRVPLLGDADPRLYLFGEHFVEHQRHFPQLYPQSLFSFAAAESLVQHH